MPLPWLMVFFLIFLCIYTVFLFISSFSFFCSTLDKPLNSASADLPW